jgi:hypothetical protein
MSLCAKDCDTQWLQCVAFWLVSNIPVCLVRLKELPDSQLHCERVPFTHGETLDSADNKSHTLVVNSPALKLGGDIKNHNNNFSKFNKLYSVFSDLYMKDALQKSMETLNLKSSSNKRALDDSCVASKSPQFFARKQSAYAKDDSFLFRVPAALQ